MHIESMELMKSFIDKYLDKNQSRRIIDVGSQRVKAQSMTYKNLMSSNWVYEGLDIAEGLNVDIVVKDPYEWKEVKDETYDVVISGQALEHAKFPWMVVQEIARVLKKNGLVCIIVPSQGFEHKFPLDCFRYLPDGGKALFEYAGLEVIECYRNNSLPWRDLIIIGKKI